MIRPLPDFQNMGRQAHADHISGAQVFQRDGATVVTNQRAVEPVVGERLATAIPDRVFDRDMTIMLGGDTYCFTASRPW